MTTSKKTIKTAYYQDFRGIDLSSDPTLCDKKRSPYLLNMYKDYVNSYGKSIETIPGFSQRIDIEPFIGRSLEVVALHKYSHDGIEGIVVHADRFLYFVTDLTELYGIQEELAVPIDSDGNGVMPFEISKVLDVSYQGESFDFYLSNDNKHILLSLGERDISSVVVKYKKYASPEPIYSDIHYEGSYSTMFMGKLLIMDGEKIVAFDGESVEEIDPYIPTTFSGISSTSAGERIEQRNLLTGYFYNELLGDGVTTEFMLSEQNLGAECVVHSYGELVNINDYTVDVVNGTITFDTPPPAPQSEGYDDGYAGIKVKLYAPRTGQADNINCMKKCVLFDDRLFVAQSSINKNRIFFSEYRDYTYFPEINFQTIGSEEGEVKELVVCGDELFVFKTDSESGSIFSLSPQKTGVDGYETSYPSTTVSTNLGAKGECINFLNSPCFISRLGVKQIAKAYVSGENVIEHRSSLIDSDLFKYDLSEAKLLEWRGYLCVIVGGYMYLGDYRERHRNPMGELELEWFKVGEVGYYDGQYQKCEFATTISDELLDITTLAPKELRGSIANMRTNDCITRKTANVDGKTLIYYEGKVKEQIANLNDDGEIELQEQENAYLVDVKQDMIGGDFIKPTACLVLNDNIYFSAKNKVLAFNFDKFVDGELSSDFYKFDKRLIKSYLATKLDNVNCPNSLKSTVKNSLVIKCKTKKNSSLKIKVRTDKKPYHKIGEINNGYFDFGDVNFEKVIFNVSDQQIFKLKEKEKKWLEKQLVVYSEEAMSVYYMAYRYWTA